MERMIPVTINAVDFIFSLPKQYNDVHLSVLDENNYTFTMDKDILDENCALSYELSFYKNHKKLNISYK
jgi:hypothetical protein